MPRRLHGGCHPARRRGGPHAGVPDGGAGATPRRPPARGCHPAQPAPAARGGGVRPGHLRQPSVRTRAPGGRRRGEVQPGAGEAALDALRRLGPGAPLRRGTVRPRAVRTAVEEAFGGWHKAKGVPRPKAAPKAGRRVFLLDRPGAVQSTVRFGLPAIPPTSPDYIPLVVTDALLGGSFGSRITANIREKRGYTYSPRSVLGLHPGVGTWLEAADVTTKDTAASVREIVNEIRAAPEGAPVRRGARRHPEVRGRHLRPPQQQPRGDRHPAPLRGPPRAAGGLAPQLRPAGAGGHARGRHRGSPEIPRPAADDPGGGGRPEGGGGLAEAVRAGEGRGAERAVPSGSSADRLVHRKTAKRILSGAPATGEAPGATDQETPMRHFSMSAVAVAFVVATVLGCGGRTTEPRVVAGSRRAAPEQGPRPLPSGRQALRHLDGTVG